MAWIESHSVLVDHRKVRECAAILGIPKAHLIGHLHCLWHKVIELAEDGVISDWSVDDISYYSQWTGDAELFYKTISGRFIDEKKGEKVIHDWLDYAWKYLYRKYHTANPKRLEEIQKIHKKTVSTKGKPKISTKGYTQVVLPNQPNIPNQPKEETAGKKPPTPSCVTEFMFIYDDLYRQTFMGITPPITGNRDGPTVKRLLKYGDSESLGAKLPEYFRSVDQFIKNNAYDIPRFEKWLAGRAVGGYQEQQGGKNAKAQSRFESRSESRERELQERLGRTAGGIPKTSRDSPGNISRSAPIPD